MARFEVNEGPPGQGKSIYQAALVQRLVERNSKWFDTLSLTYETRCDQWRATQKAVYQSQGLEASNIWVKDHPTPIEPRRRQIKSNQKFSAAFETYAKDYLGYWTELDEITDFRHCDIIWDEVATDLDSRNWPLLSNKVKRFLSQYRKRGVDIYANTQDFSMIDVRARLMITGVKTLKKVIGSPDLSTTKPPPKTIWGVVLILTVNNFKETDVLKKRYSLFDFSFMLIEKELVDIYDTRQDIKVGNLPPLRHEERVCELHGTSCKFIRVSHV